MNRKAMWVMELSGFVIDWLRFQEGGAKMMDEVNVDAFH